MKGSNGYVMPMSERQRVVVVTFADEDQARAWDDAGQPVCLSCECARPVDVKP